jgi:hypothetical protein
VFRANHDRLVTVIQPIYRESFVQEPTTQAPSNHSIVLNQQDFHPLLRKERLLALNAKLIPER